MIIVVCNLIFEPNPWKSSYWSGRHKNFQTADGCIFSYCRFEFNTIETKDPKFSGRGGGFLFLCSVPLFERIINQKGKVIKKFHFQNWILPFLKNELLHSISKSSNITFQTLFLFYIVSFCGKEQLFFIAFYISKLES